MMPRTNRLTRRTFESVLFASSRRTSPHFSLQSKKQAGGVGSCAAVVSKKVEKTAVGRHLLKRRMLVALKDHLQKGYSYILYARKGAETLSFAELKKELDTLLSDAQQ